jgi:hypothetical protein
MRSDTICRNSRAASWSVQQAGILVLVVPFPDVFFEQAGRGIQQRKPDLIGTF